MPSIIGDGISLKGRVGIDSDEGDWILPRRPILRGPIKESSAGIASAVNSPTFPESSQEQFYPLYRESFASDATEQGKKRDNTSFEEFGQETRLGWPCSQGLPSHRSVREKERRGMNRESSESVRSRRCWFPGKPRPAGARDRARHLGQPARSSHCRRRGWRKNRVHFPFPWTPMFSLRGSSMLL
jgi:hypothetical protein